MAWITAIAAACMALPLCQEEEAKAPEYRVNPVVADGGNADEFPDNTLPALESALEMGVAWIRVPVQETKDGHLVVVSPNHPAVRKPRVWTMTLEEVLACDMAAPFREAHFLDPEACPPQQALTLDAAFARIQAQTGPVTRLLLVPFPDLTDALIEWIGAHDAAPWVGVQGGSPDSLAKYREASEHLPLFWLRPEVASDQKDLARTEGLGLTAMVYRQVGITPERQQFLQSHGLAVAAQDLSAFLRIEQLLANGLDFVIVPNPRHALLIVEKQKEKQGAGGSP